MTEQQPYTVVQHFDEFEVREYPSAAIAEVTVNASFEAAGNRAFGSLFGYISGRNRGERKIAMTAPVLQRRLPDDRHSIAFVLPAAMTTADAPQPDDASIAVTELPGSRTAALRYSGRWSQGAFDEHTKQLKAAIARAGFTAVGEPRFARYNAPFTPWFLRRNEVLIDLAN